MQAISRKHTRSFFDSRRTVIIRTALSLLLFAVVLLLPLEIGVQTFIIIELLVLLVQSTKLRLGLSVLYFSLLIAAALLKKESFSLVYYSLIFLVFAVIMVISFVPSIERRLDRVQKILLPATFRFGMTIYNLLNSLKLLVLYLFFAQMVRTLISSVLRYKEESAMLVINAYWELVIVLVLTVLTNIFRKTDDLK